MNNSYLLWAVLGAGAYVAYNVYTDYVAAVSVVPPNMVNTNTSNNPTGTTTNGQATNTTTISPVVSLNAPSGPASNWRMRDWLLHGKNSMQHSGSMLNFGQWSQVYVSIYSGLAPRIEESGLPGKDPNKQLTVDEFVLALPSNYKNFPGANI